MLISPGPLGNPAADPRLHPTGLAAFTLSLITNSMVTGLIIVKLWRIMGGLRSVIPEGYHRNDRTYKAVIALLIETGLAIFVAQLLYVVFFETRYVFYVLFSSAITQVYVSLLSWARHLDRYAYYSYASLGNHTDGVIHQSADGFFVRRLGNPSWRSFVPSIHSLARPNAKQRDRSEAKQWRRDECGGLRRFRFWEELWRGHQKRF